LAARRTSSPQLDCSLLCLRHGRRRPASIAPPPQFRRSWRSNNCTELERCHDSATFAADEPGRRPPALHLFVSASISSLLEPRRLRKARIIAAGYFPNHFGGITGDRHFAGASTTSTSASQRPRIRPPAAVGHFKRRQWSACYWDRSSLPGRLAGNVGPTNGYRLKLDSPRPTAASRRTYLARARAL